MIIQIKGMSIEVPEGFNVEIDGENIRLIKVETKAPEEKTIDPLALTKELQEFFNEQKNNQLDQFNQGLRYPYYVYPKYIEYPKYPESYITWCSNTVADIHGIS